MSDTQINGQSDLLEEPRCAMNNSSLLMTTCRGQGRCAHLKAAQQLAVLSSMEPPQDGPALPALAVPLHLMDVLRHGSAQGHAGRHP